MNEKQENNRKAFLMGALSCLVLVMAAVAVLSAFGGGRFMTGKQWEYYKGLHDRFGKLCAIEEMIDADPLAEYTAEDINDARLKQIVGSIGDPYAEYYTPEEYEEFEKKFLSDYVGIGIGVADEEGTLVIRTVYEGGPAAEAGIAEGDIIDKVDGKVPADIDEAIDMMTGEAGTEVTVTILRDGKSMDFKMTREKIEMESVTSEELDEAEDVGYIRISTFRKGTDKEFKAAVEELEDEGCDRFIIDLRDNGGGLTDVCIEIADYLLPACKIMKDVKKDGTEKVYSSDAKSAGIEIVILVNGNTASASEILAGAIQDNNAGTIIGTKTFGKGVTQITRKFDDGSAIKITETEYFRPNGDKVHGVGITPDIQAEDGDAMDAALKELGE